MSEASVKALRAVYYRDDSGHEPVATFIDALPPKARAAVKNQISRLNLLNDDCPHLPFPHSSQVRGEIRELRCHWGRNHIRCLYARSERLIVLLHAFPKASERVPESEVSIAESRFDDFKLRMNAAPRRAPRAAGADAP